MLIAKIFVNEKQIDEIWIHNTGKVKDGIFEYRIKKPEGCDDHPLFHKRSAGYETLLTMALSLITYLKKA
jgi:hypothetical protein